MSSPTSKKDLNNIKIFVGVGDVQRHPNNQKSVCSWVHKWSTSDSNTILFTKFQGDDPTEVQNLTKDDSNRLK